MIRNFKSIFSKKSNMYTFVILDSNGSELVKKVIPSNHTYFVLDIRRVRYIISLKLFFKFLNNLYLLFDNYSFKQKNDLLITTVLRRIKSIYIKSWVDMMNPKFVISYIDNSIHLHFLCKNSKSYKVIGIQNGTRAIHNTKFSKYYLDYFFCYGEHEKNLFIKNNARIKYFIPCGSLRSSLSSDLNLLRKKDEFDILIVSGWRGNSDPYNLDSSIETMNSMYKMDKLLAKIILKKKYKYSIELRSQAGGPDWNMKDWGNEEDYYRKIYGKNSIIHYFDQKEGKIEMPIYNLMLKSNLSISVLSSAVFEVFGYGKKILLCNFTGDNKIHCWNNLIQTNDDTLEGLSQLIDNLISSKFDQEKYIKYSKYIMNYPKNNLVDNFIRDQIVKIIGK